MLTEDGFFFIDPEPEQDDDGRGPSVYFAPAPSAPSQARMPDEVILPADEQYPDKNLDWQIKHKMRQTSGKQAGQLVQVRRQAELDIARVEQAAYLRVRAVEISAEYMDNVFTIGDSYARGRPELAARVQAMVDEAADDLTRLPRAGFALFLRRYGFG
jgi:hypothetical protein